MPKVTAADSVKTISSYATPSPSTSNARAANKTTLDSNQDHHEELPDAQRSYAWLLSLLAPSLWQWYDTWKPLFVSLLRENIRPTACPCHGMRDFTNRITRTCPHTLPCGQKMCGLC